MKAIKPNQKGFTLVELLLAMAFIAFLLIFTVSVIMQLTLLYSKGLATRQINQTGRQVVDALSRSLRDTKPRPAGAQRLCVDGTTYVWNTSSSIVNNYADGAPVGFVSVADPTGTYCSGSNVPRNLTKDLLGPNLSVVTFTVTPVGRLWDIKLLISTGGSNIVQNVGGKFECPVDNKFCSFGEFDTSVYIRRQ